MLRGALKQTDCLRGVVMMRVIVRIIGPKRNFGGRRIFLIRGDVSVLSLRLQVLRVGILRVVIAAGEMFTRVMPVVAMARMMT
jgi:hypothetical protein